MERVLAAAGARRASTACSSTRPKLQNKQAFLFRLVDIANELFAMAAAVSRAKALAERKAARRRPQAAAHGRRLLPLGAPAGAALFRELWSNDDVLRYRHGLGVLAGADQWLEAGIMDLQAKKAAPVAEKQEVPVGA